MANQRLRDALLRNGMTTEDAAGRAGVDPKTVERWITTGRTPYPKHRHKIATLLREAESYLWPDALEGLLARSCGFGRRGGLAEGWRAR